MAFAGFMQEKRCIFFSSVINEENLNLYTTNKNMGLEIFL